MAQHEMIGILPKGAGWVEKFLIVDGVRREGLVRWSEMVPKGMGTDFAERKEWLPVEQLARIKGVDYSQVEDVTEKVDQPVSPAATGAGGPPGWPAKVLPPGTPGWEKSVTTFLLEALPSNYQAHAKLLHEHPLALATAAQTHVQLGIEAARAGFRTAAVDLREHLPRHAVDEVLDVYRQEGPRLVALSEAIAVVGQALASHSKQ